MVSCKLFILLILPVGIAGCSAKSPDPAGSEDWFTSASAAEQARYFRKACDIYGISADSPAMAQCIRDEIARRHDDNAERDNRQLAQIETLKAQHRTTQTRCTDFGTTRSCESY